MSDIEKKAAAKQAAEKEAAVQKAVSSTAPATETAPQKLAADKALDAQAAVERAAVEKVVADKAAADKAAVAKAAADDLQAGIDRTQAARTEPLPIDRESIEERAQHQVAELPKPNLADTLPQGERPRIAQDLAYDDDERTTMTVVTTAIGAGKDGIVAIGSRMEVDPSLFSPNWMRPADNKEARKLEAWRKKKV